ncbi:MAG: TadE/TadG family type IV pilus assembly protein [Acidimicrobiales bacterium]
MNGIVVFLLGFTIAFVASGVVIAAVKAKRTQRERRWSDERGVAVLEMVLLVPVFLVLVFFAVAMGRLGQAREDIDAVARDAARAGSIARSPDDARLAAETTASDVLASHHLTCAGLAVNVDTADFRPGGWVRVDVSCTISVADLAGIWAPGDKTMQARGLAVVDAFRRTD